MARDKTSSGARGSRRSVSRRKRWECCGGSRLWIFLVLGALVEVLGLVVGGIYLNVRSLTSSLQHTEILPTYVPVAAVLFTGLLVLILFWKRLHLLVFLTSVISVGVGLLCAGTAILMGTHILRPMMHFTLCSQTRDQCNCLSPYNRQQLSLKYSEQALTTYVYAGVTDCSVVQTNLIHMLFALCGAYAIVFVVCVVVAILALLAYRTERLHKRSLESDSYEEIFTVSNSSSTPPNTDPDSDTPLQHHQPHHRLIHSPSSSSSSHPHRRTLDAAAATTTTDFIYSPSDIPVDYNEACKMRQRSHSFSQPRRQNHSFESNPDDDLDPATSSFYASSTLGRRGQGQGQGQGRLKDNRRRARRAVTLANLDHQQLMLIMSLQLRYLEENGADNKFQANTRKLERQSRRAVTPTPGQERGCGGGGMGGAYSDVDTRPVKLVRSHTPQPHPTYLPTPPPPSFFSAADYENGFVPLPLDYENCGSNNSGSAGAAAAPPRPGKSTTGAYSVPAYSGPRGNSAERTQSSRVRTELSPLESVSMKKAVTERIALQGGACNSSGSASNKQDDGYMVMQRGAARTHTVPQRPVKSPSISSNVSSLNGMNVTDLSALPSRVNGVTSAGSVTSSGSVTSPPARANSYENVDNMSACGIPSAAHRDPLYENQKESLASKRLRRRASNPKQPQPDGPGVVHRDTDHPARPKSYINAVEGVESSTPSDDSERDDPRRPAAHRSAPPRHHHPHHQQNHHQSQPALASSSHHAPVHSYPAGMVSSTPASTFTASADPRLNPQRGMVDIYAQPNKKGRPLPPRPDVDGQMARNGSALSLPGDGRHHSMLSLPSDGRNSSLSVLSADGGGDGGGGGSGSRKSAFHKVSRPPPPPYAGAPCDTDLDDLEPLPYPRPRKKTSASRATPYSSPPSYECLVSSRHGSVHSLASSSSHNTADDLDSELYKQIRKNKSGAVGKPGSRGGSSQHLNSPGLHGDSGVNSSGPHGNGSSQHLNSDIVHNGHVSRLGQFGHYGCDQYGSQLPNFAVNAGGIQALPNFAVNAGAVNAGGIHAPSTPGYTYANGKVGQGQGQRSYTSGWEGMYYHGDHPGIHSFPFRKHHPPSTSPYPRPHHHNTNAHNGSILKPSHARSYEDLDEVFVDPPPPGLDTVVEGQGRGVTSGQPFDINSNRMAYQDVVHLASGNDRDSDSEFMETII